MKIQERVLGGNSRPHTTNIHRTLNTNNENVLFTIYIILIDDDDGDGDGDDDKESNILQHFESSNS